MTEDAVHVACVATAPPVYQLAGLQPSAMAGESRSLSRRIAPPAAFADPMKYAGYLTNAGRGRRPVVDPCRVAVCV